ncbi:MAG: histidinol-phosphate transaminase [SAR324 cluster bacterium]|uniref:Histidinol-phosphate aminotransferase n=1 Tax=SAR324 cluster bacterium TaxID=2024889 RepID=A0A2A4SR73_9DELT|nr:MAG: histidinol-phosphate transaminase [SAR324 cluster bacterium]
MSDIQEYFCPSLRDMAPYSPIEPPDQIAKRLKLPEEEIIKLDANENPYGTAPHVLEALSRGKYYHIYPDPAQVELREAIGQYAGVDPEMVVGGTGADELIDLACRLLIEPGDKVLTFTPTFSYYSHLVTLNKGIFQTCPREPDFSISLEKVKQLDLSGVKLVFLCSPNNPSGNLLEEEILDYFLAQSVIVCVDEAYYEFSRCSFVGKLKKHNNLIILRTFSKCFGLAGLRVGYGLMSRELAAAMMRIKPPYSVNVAAEVALRTCLKYLDSYEQQVVTMIETREWFQEQLAQFSGLNPFPSHSNYILVKATGLEAKEIWKQLEQQGILVRYFNTPQLNSCFRISIGRREQMERLLKALQELLSP